MDKQNGNSKKSIQNKDEGIIEEKEGNSYLDEKKAEGDLYLERKIIEGDIYLAKKIAEAEKKKKRSRYLFRRTKKIRRLIL